MAALDERDPRQDEGDDEADRERRRAPPLGSRPVSPAPDDILRLELERLRVVWLRRCGEPGLRSVEVASTEQERPVASIRLPLSGSLEQPSVRVPVLDVAVDGVHERPDHTLERIAVLEV